jgi:predicted alpha/beta hydrolase
MAGGAEERRITSFLQVTAFSRREIATSDGHFIVGRFFVPREVPKAAVLIVPAMGVRQEYYAPLAAWLATQGYCAAMVEALCELLPDGRLNPEYAVGVEGDEARAMFATVTLPIVSISFTDDEYMSARNTESILGFFATLTHPLAILSRVVAPHANTFANIQRDTLRWGMG